MQCLDEGMHGGDAVKHGETKEAECTEMVLLPSVCIDAWAGVAKGIAVMETNWLCERVCARVFVEVT